MLEMLLAASTEVRLYDLDLACVISSGTKVQVPAYEGIFRIEIRVHVQLLTVVEFEAELGLHLDIVEYIIVVTAILRASPVMHLMYVSAPSRDQCAIRRHSNWRFTLLYKHRLVQTHQQINRTELLFI